LSRFSRPMGARRFRLQRRTRSPCMLTQPRNRRLVGRLIAKVIEFYVPNRFQKKVAWVPPQKRGKEIEFCVQVKKTADAKEGGPRSSKNQRRQVKSSYFARRRKDQR